MDHTGLGASGRLRRGIWLAAWLIALTTRLLFPLSDPPVDLSWSGGYYADEGFWVHDARNELLFGDAAGDEWHNKWVSPTIHYPVKLIFSLTGPGLPGVRVWAAILSVLTLLLLDRISRRLDPDGWLFLAFSVNSILVAYQRTAILESAVLPAATLTMWLWLIGREKTTGATRIIIDLATGMAAAWVWQIKATQLYFLPLVPIATWIVEPRKNRARISMMYQIAGMFPIALAWYCLIRIPHAGLLRQYNSYYMFQQGSSVTDILRNVITQPPGLYFNRLPVLFPASLLITGLLIIRRKFKLVPPVISFSSVWFLLGLLSLMPLGYRPLRYYLPMTIPMIILGFRLLTNHETRAGLMSLGGLNKAVIAFIVVLPAGSNVPLILDRWWLNGRLTGFSDLQGFSYFGSIATTVIAGVMLAFLVMPRHLSGRVFTILLILSFGLQAGLVGKRLTHRTYDVLESSRKLAGILPAGSVIGGQWAPQLVLETPFRAIPVWKGFVNWDNPFERYGITHMLSWEYSLGNELDMQKKWFPEVMSQAEKLDTFVIKNSPVTLWRVTENADRGR